MSGKVKLGEADYNTYSGKHCYLCQISYVKYPGKGLLMPKAFSRLFAVRKCEKHLPQMYFLRIR